MPPGIGKTTAIEAFRAANDANVAVVSVAPGPRGGISPTTALQMLLEGLYDLSPNSRWFSIPTKYMELRGLVFTVVCEWAGYTPLHAKRGGVDASNAPLLTVIFDEAQNLSRNAIEELRFVNDTVRGCAPFPLGMVFIGNNDFILKSDARGESVLSAAVADRALFNETLNYTDVTDKDLSLFLEAAGIAEVEVRRLLVRYFASGRVNRSFRRVRDLLDDIAELAEGASITTAHVREYLSL